MNNILIFCAHPDDEVIGAGATIAKYAKEGKNIFVIIFTYGESSNPLLKKKITIETRVKESKEIGKSLGCKETIFLGVPEGKISKKLKDTTFINKISSLVKKYNPNKIFTHTSSDILHQDHVSVNKVITKVIDNLDKKYSLYTFPIWNPLRFLKRENPRLFVDVTKTFQKKIKAMKLFESQKIFTYPLLPAVYLRAKVYGMESNCKYAEKFYKIR
ncbi:hypothetical protein CL621_01990 [archaeon]|nr:hypothetical protein [archaeon]|tara:strand:- start:2183 stop:2827 length:645 start_codon:yes stop_codon:yes gene_type:complete